MQKLQKKQMKSDQKRKFLKADHFKKTIFL